MRLSSYFSTCICTVYILLELHTLQYITVLILFYLHTLIFFYLLPTYSTVIIPFCTHTVLSSYSSTYTLNLLSSCSSTYILYCPHTLLSYILNCPRNLLTTYCMYSIVFVLFYLLLPSAVLALV